MFELSYNGCTYVYILYFNIETVTNVVFRKYNNDTIM